MSDVLKLSDSDLLEIALKRPAAKCSEADLTPDQLSRMRVLAAGYRAETAPRQDAIARFSRGRWG